MKYNFEKFKDKNRTFRPYVSSEDFVKEYMKHYQSDKDIYEISTLMDMDSSAVRSKLYFLSKKGVKLPKPTRSKSIRNRIDVDKLNSIIRKNNELNTK